MNNAIFQSNVKSLNAIGIDLQKVFLKNQIKMSIVKAINLEDTMIIKYQSKNEYIHSKYNPTALANSIYSKKTLAQFTVFFGVGLGYELISLLSNSTKDSTVVIFEPHYEIMTEFLQRFELNKLNCKCIICAGLEQLTTILSNASMEEIENLQFLHTYGYLSVFSNYTIQIADEINRIRTEQIFKSRWILERSRSVFCNSTKNLHHFVNGSTLDTLKNMFTNIPGIVVSSGPSLTKNVHLLKQIKGKFLIVCVYSAYKILIDNNIEPDFVIATDEIQPVLELHLKQGFNNNLIMTSQLNPQLANCCNGKKIFRITETDGLTKTILNKFDKNIISIPQGGSVSCSAYSFLEFVGCNPMILIGTDLAFSDDITHAVGTQGSMPASSDTYSKIYVDSITNTPIQTTVQLKYYLDWFVEYIRTLPPHIVCINATEGGANIDGATNIKLSTVIQQYNKIDTNISICNIKKTFTTDEKSKVIHFLLESYKEFDKIIALAKNGLSATDIKSINNIDISINSFSQILELIFVLYQEVDLIYNNFKCDSSVNSIIKRHHLRYSKLIEVCEFAKAPLYDAINEIKRGDFNE